MGKLAERHIWLDTWDLWGIVSYDNLLLESWGDPPTRHRGEGSMSDPHNHQFDPTCSDENSFAEQDCRRQLQPLEGIEV